MSGPRTDRFFTPPAVPKVDLRVATLSGGGACPSQFWGLTPDGREVYIRYRNGFLTIDVADAPGQKAALNGNVLTVCLGPPFDGVLSAQQLIALTDLQVGALDNARSTGETELDLSGATTFWTAIGLSVTLSGAEHLLSTLWSNFPGLEISQISWSHEEGCTARALSADETPKETVLELSLGDACPKISLRYSGFKYDFPGYGAPDSNARFSDDVKRKVEVVGSRGCDIKYESMRLSSEFRSGDTVARSWLERLDKTLDICFPEIEYAPYDLASGERTEAKRLRVQDDPAITNWVQQAPHRFRYIRRASREAPLIGYRLP